MSCPLGVSAFSISLALVSARRLWLHERVSSCRMQPRGEFRRVFDYFDRIACLGRKEDAINEGKKAVELLPESEDAVEGPKATAALAEIYASVGEHDEAFLLLDHLLAVPNGLTRTAAQARPSLGPFACRPAFPKTLRGEAAVMLRTGQHFKGLSIPRISPLIGAVKLGVAKPLRYVS